MGLIASARAKTTFLCPRVPGLNFQPTSEFQVFEGLQALTDAAPDRIESCVEATQRHRMRTPKSGGNHVPVPRSRNARTSTLSQPVAVESRQHRTLAQSVEEQLLNPGRPSTLGSPTASCTVPACSRPYCDLRTHRKYAALVLHQKTKKEQHRKGAVVNQKASSIVDGWAHLLPPIPTITRDGVDGFPFMPIPDQLDLGLRDLFHHFFTNVFDRLVLVFRAPPVPKDFKSRMLQVALTTPAYCMAIVSPPIP